MLTDADLAAIEQRANAVGECRLEVRSEHLRICQIVFIGGHDESRNWIVATLNDQMYGEGEARKFGELFAHAKDDQQKLLAEVRRLREELAEARRLLDAVWNNIETIEHPGEEWNKVADSVIVFLARTEQPAAKLQETD